MQFLGSLPAFEDLFDAYRSLVRNVALRITANRDDADDVVQDVFLKVWSRPDAFHGGNVESWLTTVTRNAALDRIRRSTPANGCLSLDACKSLCAQEQTEADALALVDLANLYAALEELDEQSRSLIVAAFIKHQSHSQISALLDLPLGTVKTRMRVGLARLRKVLYARYTAS